VRVCTVGLGGVSTVGLASGHTTKLIGHAGPSHYGVGATVWQRYRNCGAAKDIVHFADMVAHLLQTRWRNVSGRGTRLQVVPKDGQQAGAIPGGWAHQPL
jgi:hypothetical protein